MNTRNSGERNSGGQRCEPHIVWSSNEFRSLKSGIWGADLLKEFDGKDGDAKWCRILYVVYQFLSLKRSYWSYRSYRKANITLNGLDDGPGVRNQSADCNRLHGQWERRPKVAGKCIQKSFPTRWWKLSTKKKRSTSSEWCGKVKRRWESGVNGIWYVLVNRL